MCQVHQSEDQPVPVAKDRYKFSNLCGKCEEKAIIVVGTNGTFCRECFENYFTHKFRASMGKNPIVRHGDKVAVAYSGGSNSSALLNLIKEGLSPQAPRKLKFEAGVIFVDEGSVYDSDEDRCYVTEVKSVLSSVGFPVHFVKLEDVFKNDESATEIAGDTLPRDKLRNLLDSCTTLTSKMELLSRLRLKLLSHKAKELGYNHVFLGECCSRLAVNILTSVALGRGIHIPQDSGFSDGDRFKESGVNMLRPMRDISAKEIAVYNMIHKVETVYIPNLSTEKGAMSSIQRLTEEFVTNLVAGYPATETTVYRTSNKIKPNKVLVNVDGESVKKNLKKCVVCLGYVDSIVKPDKPTAVEDSILSEAISGGKYLNNCEYSADVALTVEPSDLCHACRVLAREVNQPIQVLWPI